MTICFDFLLMGLGLWATEIGRFRTLYHQHLYALGEIPLGVWLRDLASVG
jgi:hypothetical protein